MEYDKMESMETKSSKNIKKANQNRKEKTKTK